MGLFKDITQTVKNIFSADDDMMFDDDNDFEQTNQNPILKKANEKKNNPFAKSTMPSFDLGNHGFDMAKANQSRNARSNGKIQIYVPKSFEEAFTIIKDVRSGFTAMVNVEVANPQISQRIIDIVSGAIYALDGECKKMGEKQYIFSLSAETIGAYDYLPTNGNQVMPPQTMGFNFNMGQNYDINQGIRPGNNNFGAQSFNNFNQPSNNVGQGSYNQNNFGQNNFNASAEQLSQNLQNFYVPPKSQF